MVAFNDLATVQQLYAEARFIDTALEYFESGGEIVEMKISQSPMPQSEPFWPAVLREGFASVTVSTVGISYPPQMVEAIKAAFTERRASIDQALAGFGVTNIDEAARIAGES